VRVASILVLAIFTALALPACRTVRDDVPHEDVPLTPWPPTQLSAQELSDAKSAAGFVQDTHVFDWNTVTARRKGTSLHVLVSALPEPQTDGSIFEPQAECFGEPDGWSCEVRISHSLYTQVEVHGMNRRVAITIRDRLAATEAAALVQRALEVLPSVAGSSECSDVLIRGGGTIDELRAAFANTGVEMPLLVGRDGARLRVRRRQFEMKFERVDGDPHAHAFVCWSDEPILVTS
jgi:hypothetical protein